jgi:hypothetical protein
LGDLRQLGPVVRDPEQHLVAGNLNQATVSAVASHARIMAVSRPVVPG